MGVCVNIFLDCNFHPSKGNIWGDILGPLEGSLHCEDAKGLYY